MKKKIISRLTLLLIIMTALTLFAGCDLMNADVQSDAVEGERVVSTDAGAYVLASSKKVGTEFTATVFVQQQSVKTEMQGNSDRWKSTDEVLVGTVVSSDWEALQGAEVTMNNFTNFTMVPIVEGPYTGTFTVSGTNHSTINVAMLNGDSMTMKANGSISGNIPFGANVDMGWTTIGSKGKGQSMKYNAKGDLTGSFVWYTYPPSGYFQLTGSYK